MASTCITLYLWHSEAQPPLEDIEKIRNVELRFFDVEKNAATHNNNSAHNSSAEQLGETRQQQPQALRTLRAQSESKKADST